MSEHDMPCAWEANNNDGFKREYLQSCPSTTKNIVSPLQQYIWPPDLGGWLLTMRVPLQIYLTLRSHALARSCDNKTIISQLSASMATRLGRMVTYLEDFQSIKSHTWNRGLARSRKKIKPLCLQYHHTYGHQTWQNDDLPCVAPYFKNYSNFWSLGPARSRDKLEPIYLHYQNTYKHQPWQVYDLLWGVSFRIVMWPFN